MRAIGFSSRGFLSGGQCSLARHYVRFPNCLTLAKQTTVPKGARLRSGAAGNRTLIMRISSVLHTSPYPRALHGLAASAIRRRSCQHTAFIFRHTPSVTLEFIRPPPAFSPVHPAEHSEVLVFVHTSPHPCQRCAVCSDSSLPTRVATHQLCASDDIPSSIIVALSMMTQPRLTSTSTGRARICSDTVHGRKLL